MKHTMLQFFHPRNILPVTGLWALATCTQPSLLAEGVVTVWGPRNGVQMQPPLDLTNAVTISAGPLHIVAQKADGELVAWGDARLGLSEIPAAASNVVSVASGFRHNLVLRSDGSIFGWGDDILGQATAPSGKDYVAIAAGDSHSLALRPDGTAVAWGANQHGQGDIPWNVTDFIAIAAGANHSLGLRMDGTVMAWGYNENGQTAVPAGLTNVLQIASGYHHNLALRSDGTVVAWGYNNFGQTEVPEGLTDVIDIAAGLSSSLAICANGKVVSWGGDPLNPRMPEGLQGVQSVAAGAGFGVAIVSTPAIIRQPFDTLIDPAQPLNLSVVAMGGDALHLQWQKDGVDIPGETGSSLNISDPDYSLFGDYRLKATEGDSVVYSQIARMIAVPVILSQPEPAYVYYGEDVTFHVAATGTPPLRFQWYRDGSALYRQTNGSLSLLQVTSYSRANYSVEISNEAGSVRSLPTELFVRGKPNVDIRNATEHVRFDGELYIGPSMSGSTPDSLQWQLNGIDIPGATEFVLRMSNMRPAMAGAYRYAAVSPAGRVYSPEVQVTIGRADPVNHVGREMVLDAGTPFGQELSYRWFHNGKELIGRTNSTLSLPSLVEGDAGDYTALVTTLSGEHSVEVASVTVLPAPPVGQLISWGNPIDTPEFPLSRIQDAIGFSMNHNYALILRANGEVVRHSASGRSIMPHPTLTGPVLGVSSFDFGNALLGVSGMATGDVWPYCDPCVGLEDERFIQVAMGDHFALGLRRDGTVFGWGKMEGGNPVPPTLSNVVKVAAGYSHAIAMRNDGSIAVWGNNTFGTTNIPPRLSAVVDIASGRAHCLALDSYGTVWAWGHNTLGQTDVPRGLSNVIAIGAGPEQSYAILEDGSIRAWGANETGQSDVPSGLAGAVQVDGSRYSGAALIGSTNLPAILTHPLGGVSDIGDDHFFEVRSWSPVEMFYQWMHDGEAIQGATNATLRVSDLGLEDRGGYTVRITTFAGTVESDAAVLFINPPPFLSLPPNRGRVVGWGDIVIPDSLGEVAALSSGPLAWGNISLNLSGVATVWNGGSLLQLPESNLVSVVRSADGFLGLRDNGVVASWTTSGGPIDPPQGLRDVVNLSADGAGNYIAVRNDGTLKYPSGQFDPSPTNAVQAAVGYRHAIALLADGTVAMSELNPPTRQTPAPAGLSNVVQVAAGAHHSLALRANGHLVAWGLNSHGQCDVPTNLTNIVQVAAGANFSMALTAEGTVSVWGDGGNGQTSLPIGLTNVVAIAAGSSYCLAIQNVPVIVVRPRDTVVEAGQPAVFQVSAEGAAPLGYQWFHEGAPLPGETNSLLSLTANTETEGVYTVLVSNSDGSSSSEAYLRLGVAPEILAHPSGDTIEAGTRMDLTVQASGVGPLSYRWQVNGADIAGATNSTITLFPTSYQHNGTYRAIVDNPFGSTTSHVAQVTVLTPPNILTQPVSQTRAEGETARFEVATGGSDPKTFQWTFQGTQLPGKTNAWIEIFPVTPQSAGDYRMQVINPVGSAISESAILAVVEKSPRIVSAPAATQAEFGSTVEFSVLATGAAPLEYQWFHSGQPLSGENSDVLVLHHVDRLDMGSYQVVVSNAFGSATSAPPAQLSLVVPPNVAVWGSNEAVMSIPIDLTNAVAVAAAGHVIALRDNGTVTAWGRNNYGQADVPIGLSNVVAVAAGSDHSLALTSDRRVVAWGRNDLDQTKLPPDLTNVVHIAAGSEHNIAVRSDGTVVGWGYNISGQATPPDGLRNVVQATANFNSTVVLKSDGTVQGWGNGYFPPVGLTNIVKVSGRARMLALREDGRVIGWGWTTGGDVEGPPGIVSADSYFAPHRVGNTTYLETHEIGLLEDGTVAIWGANRNDIFTPPALPKVSAAAAGEFFNVAITGGPTILKQPNPPAVASIHTTVEFAVEAIGREPLEYQWMRNESIIPDATNSVYELYLNSPMDNGLYSVVIRDESGSVESIKSSLRVITDVPYLLESPSDRVVREGEDASFEVAAFGEGSLKYQWWHNGNALNGATNRLLQIASVIPNDVGFYNVTVSNSNGTIISPYVRLKVAVADIVVDNSEAEVHGPWHHAHGIGQLGTDHLRIPTGYGINRVRFAPELPRFGTYSVFFNGLFYGPSALTPGTLIVNHRSGSTPVHSHNSPGWNYIGSYSFNAGKSGTVLVADAPSPDHEFVFADGVMFRYEPRPPLITRQPKTIAVVEGGEAILDFEAEGTSPINIQWQFNSRNIPGANAHILQILGIKRDQAGAYRVLLTNSDGAVMSHEVQIAVVAPPLRSRFQQGALNLDWEGYGILQTSTNVLGPYSELPGLTSPVVVNPTGPQRYFRLSR